MVSLFNKFKTAAVPPPPVAAPTAPSVPPPATTPPSARRLPPLNDTPDEIEALKAKIAAMEAKKKADERASGLVTVPQTSILPPDAPKSDPSLAAKPVEGFSPVPAPQTKAEAPVAEAKKKGGRPPGAKNKPKEETATEAPGTDIEVSDYEIFEVAIGHGLTLKAKDDPKCFEFVRVDVSLKAHVRLGGDVDAARAALSKRVGEMVFEEMKNYKPELE